MITVKTAIPQKLALPDDSLMLRPAVTTLNGLELSYP